MSDQRNWDAATWEGSRKAQLRRALGLSVEQRLQELDELTETARQLASRNQHGTESADGAAQDRVSEDHPHYKAPPPRSVLPLPGCNPVPLAGYLKALGTFRLVAEQLDSTACGFWQNDQFVLNTELSRDEIRDFILQRYQPTPVLAPWNGGSGFFPKDNQSGIQPIEKGRATRLSEMRSSIVAIRALLTEMRLEERPDKDTKPALIHALRNDLSDTALAWLDAAILLSGESPKYPPLLGTGGNDGRLDFTNNFMQRLIEVIDPDTGEATEPAGSWLDGALFGQPIPELASAAIGQFAPGNAGGPNSTAGFEGGSLINPWDFILMIEGALMFAATATRRLESAQQGTLSYPFTVRPTGSGSGGTALGDEGPARAEIWLPIWSSPCSLNELHVLFSEGRATIGRRPAKDGLDFARAISRLGVDRGLEGFQRYGFMMRSGKAYLATPLNRIAVRRNPAADLIANLEGSSHWLERFRRLGRSKGASASVRSLVRLLEDGIFELAQASDDRTKATQRLLTILGEIQLYLARSPSARDPNGGNCPPVPWLKPDWLADDGSDELAIAAALAGLHGRSLEDGRMQTRLPMRVHLAPDDGKSRPAWLEGKSHLNVWGQGPLESNLANATRQRLLAADRLDLEDKPFRFTRTCSLASVARWLAGDLDTARIAALLPGLALIRLPRGGQQRREMDFPVPAVYRLLKPFFCTDAQLREAGLLPADRNLPLPGELVRRIVTNDLSGAVGIARRRLRAAGVRCPLPAISAPEVDGMRLLAALLAPVSGFELARLLPRERRTESNETT